VKLSAKFGRASVLSKIAVELAKSEEEVNAFMDAFWGDLGKSRIAEHEYDRVVKLVEKGDKKLQEIKDLERGTRVFVSHFDDPWKEVEFTHVNCKDKMFTADEDRHLLCWARKVSLDSWSAISLI
jgi:SWI/SNF-related matrix-associated actin-dependent regulator of chromatin subfamily A member 5